MKARMGRSGVQPYRGDRFSCAPKVGKRGKVMNKGCSRTFIHAGPCPHCGNDLKQKV